MRSGSARSHFLAVSALAFAAAPIATAHALDVSFARVAETGQPLPGGAQIWSFFEEFTSFIDPPALDQCRVAFPVGSTAGDVRILLSDAELLGVASGAVVGHASLDGTTVYYGEKQPADIYSWTSGTSTLVAAGGSGGLPEFLERPSADAAEVAFWGFSSDGSTAIHLEPGGGPVLVADTSTDVPGLPPGSNFEFLQSHPVLDEGLVLFEGSRSSAPARLGLYLGDGGPLTTVVDDAMMIPSKPDLFAVLVPLDLDAGTALIAGWNAGSGGLYTGSGGPLTPVVTFDDDIPEGTQKFSFVRTGSLDAGRVAFVGGASSESGVYFHDGTELHKILDESDTLDGKTPERFHLGPEALDGNQITFAVSFTAASGGGEALYVATLRDPAEKQAGAPVGTVVAWHEDLAGVPSLPDGWVRLDGNSGMLLGDPMSPYEDEMIPDWNGSGRFLRGGVCSGLEQDDAMQGHWHSMSQTGGAERLDAGSAYYQDFNPAFNLVDSVEDAVIEVGEARTGNHGPVTTASETRPDGVFVTWILKTREGAPLPIGSIIAWHPDFPGTPALLPGWAPLDGSTPPGFGKLPDANGERRFLRAGTPTGTTQDHAIQGHWHGMDDNAQRFVQGGAIGNGDFVQDFHATLIVGDPLDDGVHGPLEVDLETRPKNIAVQWMMKTAETPVPTGAILGWHRDMPGTPELGLGMMEANGQPIDHPLSPYDGQSVPDLNDEGRFLRGGSPTGYPQEHAIQGHHHKLNDNTSRFVDASAQVWGLPVISGVPVADDYPATVQPTDPTPDGVNGTPRFGFETRPINASVVWIMQVGSPVQSVEVPPLANGILGGSTVVGGVDFSFPAAAPGSIFTGSAEIVDATQAAAVLASPATLNFAIPTDPVQFWDLDMTPGFTPPVTLTFGYDDSAFLPFFAEGSLQVHRYEEPFIGCVPGADCEWIPLPKISQDLVADTITVTTTAFSHFVLGGPVLGPSTWSFSGVAAGGSIDFAVGAVFLSVATAAGDSPQTVASNVAAAINGDTTLAAAGIIANAAGHVVATNGVVTLTVVNDPGLTHGPPEIPALPTWALWLLGALLSYAIVRSGRRRRDF